MARAYAQFGIYPTWQELVAQTNKNYDSAIQWYSQKRLMFTKKLGNKADKIWDKFNKGILEKAKLFDTYINKRARECLEKGITPSKKTDGAFYITIQRLLANTSISKNGEPYIDPKALGKEFENFMAKNAFNNEDLKFALKAIEEATNMVVRNVGATQQKSWVTKDAAKQTRTDYLLNNKGRKIGQMELTKLIDLEQEVPPTELLTDLLLQQIAASGVDVNIVGFQLKTYRDFDNNRWSNSSRVQSEINNLFAKTENYSWSENYAINYPSWYISKYLLNIINPVNIGVITLNKIEYMEEFLSHIRLYMEVNWKYDTSFSASEERGGGNEIAYPKVVHDAILIKNIQKKTGTYRFQGFAPTGNTHQVAHTKKGETIRAVSITTVYSD